MSFGLIGVRGTSLPPRVVWYRQLSSVLLKDLIIKRFWPNLIFGQTVCLKYVCMVLYFLWLRICANHEHRCSSTWHYVTYSAKCVLSGNRDDEEKVKIGPPFLKKIRWPLGSEKGVGIFVTSSLLWWKALHTYSPAVILVVSNFIDWSKFDFKILSEVIRCHAIYHETNPHNCMRLRRDQRRWAYPLLFRCWSRISKRAHHVFISEGKKLL